MGDRTTAWFTIAKVDLEKAREIIIGRDRNGELDEFVEEIDNEDGTIIVVDYEANFGGDSMVDELAAAGIPVCVHHHAGGSYPEGLIAFDGTTRAEHIASEGDIVVHFDSEKGVADERSITAAREFVVVMKRAEEAMQKRAGVAEDSVSTRPVQSAQNSR